MATIAVAIVWLVVCLMAPSGVSSMQDRVIGNTVVHLDHSQCGSKECNVANLINDAMVEEVRVIITHLFRIL